MNYSEKLKSPLWQKKRLEVLQRDNFKCVCCGSVDVELHVHHLKYYKEPWDAKLEDLETLCKYCHFIKEDVKEKNPSEKIISIRIIGIERNYLVVKFENHISIYSRYELGSFIVSFSKKSDALKTICNLLYDDYGK